MSFSKQVIDDGKVADSLIEAARTSAVEIATRRHAQFIALGMKGAPSAASIEALILTDAAVLEARRTELADADAALEKELGDDAEVLTRRELHAEEVRSALVEFRDVVQTACGASVVRSLGFVGETPREPVALETLGTAVAKEVAANPPRSSKRGVKLDAKALLEGFAEKVSALRQANADLRREKREEHLARARRDEAWSAFERDLATTASILDGQLRAVGLAHVADRLIPSAPRATPADPPAPPTPA
jgi:hypothetical protein